MGKDLQIENGSYTRIANKILDELVKVPLLGAEMQLCLFIIRKTYGFNKLEDEISLTQFEKGINKSRPTIVKALKNLQLVNIIKLVKKGDSKNASNIWAFNKYYDQWTLVNRPELVKGMNTTSKVKGLQLVKRPKHTKDNTKYNITKDIIQGAKPVDEVNLLLQFFRETVNPHLSFSNKTERKAAADLIKEYGLEKVKQALVFLERKRKTDRYLPIITTPYELWTKWAKIKQRLEANQAAQAEKKGISI